MSSRKLTAFAALKHYKEHASKRGDSVSQDESEGFMAGFLEASMQDSHEIKQLQDERNKAISFLKLGIFEDARDRRAITGFLDQLNQNNEG